jgi:hypothetical protein
MAEADTEIGLPISRCRLCEQMLGSLDHRARLRIV